MTIMASWLFDLSPKIKHYKKIKGNVSLSLLPFFAKLPYKSSEPGLFFLSALENVLLTPASFRYPLCPLIGTQHLPFSLPKPPKVPFLRYLKHILYRPQLQVSHTTNSRSAARFVFSAKDWVLWPLKRLTVQLWQKLPQATPHLARDSQPKSTLYVAHGKLLPQSICLPWLPLSELMAYASCTDNRFFYSFKIKTVL